ncbi:MAG: CGCGG family rSAM-modified RiPP protein [Halobacteriaceae archaeon]
MSESTENASEKITDTIHRNSWSANLEQPEHADDQQLILTHAITAIEHTAPGNHVNLVTHENHGHPRTYLYDELEDYDGNIEWEYVDQCGCGGYITRVHVK